MRLILVSLVIGLVFSLLFATPTCRAGENLKLNPKLDYASDSNDGPHISGDQMDSGAVSGKPNYILMYGEGCYNSKRQSRRTVQLYEKYRGRVNFVIIDLDHPLSNPQLDLVKKYYRGAIPDVVVLDPAGKAVYNAAGEVDEAEISEILDKLFPR
jgi:hypothetical protein